VDRSRDAVACRLRHVDGCVGLALPVLLPVAAKLTNRFRGEVHDIHAAVLTGFLEALTNVDLTRPAILVRLRWAAYRAGHRALREALDAAAPVADLGTRAPGPEHAGGHPDFVLLAAVEAGVLTAAEAALIGKTRFGGMSLADAAHARGQTYKATQQARHRAEPKLADYLNTPVAFPCQVCVLSVFAAAPGESIFRRCRSTEPESAVALLARTNS
jgi:hypothetical protein